MNYKPISDQQHLDIVEDDGELDIVNIDKGKRLNKSDKKLFIMWIIILVLFGGILIYIQTLDKTTNEQPKIIASNYTSNDDRSKKNLFKAKKQLYNQYNQSEQDGPKLIVLEDSNQEDEDAQNKENKFQDQQNIQKSNEQENNENVIDINQQNKGIEIESSEQHDKIDQTEHLQQRDNHTEIQDKRNDLQLCKKGYYMDQTKNDCKQCEERCSECMHISGTCYQCQDQFYLNIFGKCIQNCEQNHKFNLLVSEDNKNQTIPFCLGKNHNSSLFMGVQKSKSTHFVLPYLIIHPAQTVSQVYHNNYPIVYYFNKDLFNFEGNIKLTDIVQEAQERLLIVIVLGSHTLYDFTLFNTFLFQNAVQDIELIIKAKSTQFRSYFGQGYHGYGVIRQYISQYKNNTVDLVISDDPSVIPHEEIEWNQLVTQETHITDYNFESLQGAKSEKPVTILLQHTNKDQDQQQQQYCLKFIYNKFVQCQSREIQLSNIQKMKSNFELISQFVVLLNLE